MKKSPEGKDHYCSTKSVAAVAVVQITRDEPVGLAGTSSASPPPRPCREIRRTAQGPCMPPAIVFMISRSGTTPVLMKESFPSLQSFVLRPSKHL
jgi:hypothetical protein